MRVFILPLPGKTVKDHRGRVVPSDGRYFNPSPYWIRLKNRGLIEIRIEVKEEVSEKPKRGYYSRGRGN